MYILEIYINFHYNYTSKSLGLYQILLSNIKIFKNNNFRSLHSYYYTTPTHVKYINYEKTHSPHICLTAFIIGALYELISLSD